MSQRTEPSTPPRRRRVPAWVPPAVALVVGGVAGGAIVASWGDDPGAATDAGRSAGATRPAAPVVQECLEVAGLSVRTLELAQRAAGAIGTFEARELEQVVDELEEIDPQVRRTALACQRLAADG